MHDNFDVVERLCIRVPKLYDWVQRAVKGVNRTFDEAALSALGFEVSNAPGTSDDDPFDFLDLEGGVELRMIADLSDFEVTEMSGMNGIRPTVTTVLPNGETISLQRVRVQVTGEYRIELRDSLGTVAISEPIPFSTVKTFFLCAPEGTEIAGVVSAMEDDSEVDVAARTVDVDLVLCLNVYSLMDVNIEVEGSYVSPRPELVSDVCSLNTMPPTCPMIFPGVDPDC
ncbi:hypothetical protein [Bacillus sp. CGMCC 1.16541]|uniref:hypothetical protein n=1 Tax=Bacillus sp. CGMCC 1.16541 TaxID=2185143 RepID=UPI000D73DD36|nr:hypothetical protein [Bacillus sp. CGMCC 1.16541]